MEQSNFLSFQKNLLFRLLISALLFAMPPVLAQADTVYKCKDPHGKLIYQESKCEQSDEIGKWNVSLYVPPPEKPETNAYYVSAKKGAGGVYRLDGEINGVPVNMVVDTGAALLSIPSEMADKLKLETGSQDIKLMSANGIVKGYHTKVKTLKIGRLVISNVLAVVSPNTAGILLGQSVLGLLKVEQAKDEMRLSVPPVTKKL
jgi:aspartyl protease family protein